MGVVSFDSFFFFLIIAQVKVTNDIPMGSDNGLVSVLVLLEPSAALKTAKTQYSFRKT